MLKNPKNLSDLSTFGIGGPARYFFEVRSIEEMQQVLLFCRKNQAPYFVLGKGSNCLFDTRGYDGAIILNKIDFKEEMQPGVFHVGAGYSFSLLGAQTARQGYAGLEFASGIPGSIGGAVFMNAGANGSETCNALVSVDYMDENGILRVLQKNILHFSYRTSSFQKMPGAIIGATFALVPFPEARKKQLEIIGYRKKTQPYGDMSAGCVFRNPDCAHAGALIEQCGLKGLRVGDAKVSELHANFIVNVEKASSDDVLALIEAIKARVHESTGKELESEIRYIPYEEMPS